MSTDSISRRLVNTGSEPFEQLLGQLDSLLNEQIQSSPPMTFSNVVESWVRVAQEDNEICPRNIPPQARAVLSQLLAVREQVRGIIRQLED